MICCKNVVDVAPLLKKNEGLRKWEKWKDNRSVRLRKGDGKRL